MMTTPYMFQTRFWEVAHASTPIAPRVAEKVEMGTRNRISPALHRIKDPVAEHSKQELMTARQWALRMDWMW